MAYRFAIQSEVKDSAKWCMKILHAVQDEVREYFTFDIKLIGSGDKRLVTQNNDEPFDLDYNIILQKNKKGLFNNPKQIKEIFIKRFKSVLSDNDIDYTQINNSTSVITVKIVQDNKVQFSFDIAIIVENEDGYWGRLIYDKNSGCYIWNQVENSVNYLNRFKSVKENGYWLDFKQRYLDLKNMHLSRQDGIKSFSIFLETLNEFKQY